MKEQQIDLLSQEILDELRQSDVHDRLLSDSVLLSDGERRPVSFVIELVPRPTVSLGIELVTRPRILLFVFMLKFSSLGKRSGSNAKATSFHAGVYSCPIPTSFVSSCLFGNQLAHELIPLVMAPQYLLSGFLVN